MSQPALGNVSDSSAPVQQSETPAVNFLCAVGSWLHTRSLSNEYFLDTQFRSKVRPGLDWNNVDPVSEGIATSETRMRQSGVDGCMVRDMADKDVYTLTQNQFDYMKTRILMEQNSRFTRLPLPHNQTSYQIGIPEGQQAQFPFTGWMGDDPVGFSSGGQNATFQTMSMSSSFSFSLSGAQSTVQAVYFDRAPYEGSVNTTSATQTEGQLHLPRP